MEEPSGAKLYRHILMLIWLFSVGAAILPLIAIVGAYAPSNAEFNFMVALSEEFTGILLIIGSFRSYLRAKTAENPMVADLPVIIRGFFRRLYSQDGIATQQLVIGIILLAGANFAVYMKVLRG